MQTEPRAFQLMRLLLPTRQVDCIAIVAINPHAHPYGYEYLWRWIGGDYGAVHPHPRCKYWIQAADEPALLPTSETHLVRGEN